MTKRQKLQVKINKNADKIKELAAINDDLYKENLLLSDDVRWYKEEMQQIGDMVNGKKVKMPHLVGKVCWNEDFKDGNTGEIITIERSQVVKIDGEWFNI